MPKTTHPKMSPQPHPTSFNVTQVIGTVQLGKGGDQSPDLAAFRIIADHDMPGTFTFPNTHGADTTVTVETPGEQQEVERDGEQYA